MIQSSIQNAAVMLSWTPIYTLRATTSQDRCLPLQAPIVSYQYFKDSVAKAERPGATVAKWVEYVRS